MEKAYKEGKYLSYFECVQAYSTYLLEAFAEEVKSKAKLQFCNDGYGCGIPYCDIPCQQIDPQSIDQLLTKFKEKL